MSQSKAFNIDSIIKNYENRQERIAFQLSQQNNDFADTTRYKQQYLLHQKSGASTPEFSNNPTTATGMKKTVDIRESLIERTQKKNENYHSFNPHQATSTPFSQSLQERQEYYKLLQQLDETEQKLVKAERSYTQIWRKYEKLQGQQKPSLIKDIDSVKRNLEEINELQQRNQFMQNQIQNYKYCISSKESSICILRDQLKEKNQRFVTSNNIIEDLKAQVQMWKSKELEIASQTSRKEENQMLIQKLEEQLTTFEKIISQKQSQKKTLLQELQKSYLSHKQEMEIVKAGYCKVEEEYKEWIEQCNNQKKELIKQYEHKLKQTTGHIQSKSAKLITQEKHQDQINKKDEQINKLICLSIKQTSSIKQLKIQSEKIEKSRMEVISKVSSLQNAIVIKNQSIQSLQATNAKITQHLKEQELKTNEITQRYNAINKEFIQLKNKCNVMFTQLQQNKSHRGSEGVETIRLRKELLLCREQLEKYKNNEYDVNKRLTEAVSAMKHKLAKIQGQKDEMNTDLMAERLENVKLKEQIKQTKQYLKKQYELSIKNTRKELQNQIGSINSHRKHLTSASAPYDIQKEQVYLQFRELERKYELLASEIVTVDQVISMKAKVQKRHQSFKK